MYDEKLLERNLHPRNRGKIDGIEPIRLVNSSCGDELLIYLKISKGVVVDGRFSGVGCAISLASADAFIDLIRGKKLSEISAYKIEFKKMILGEEWFLDLEEAEIMQGVSKMPARVKCAELPWKSLERDAIIKVCQR